MRLISASRSVVYTRLGSSSPAYVDQLSENEPGVVGSKRRSGAGENRSGDWRDGSVVKASYCSRRGLKLGPRTRGWGG